MSDTVDALLEVTAKAVADYGFRQAVLWSGSEIADQWGLSIAETQVLLGPVLEALRALPVPVEPADIPAEQERIARLVRDALGGS